jgi:DNA-binding YbaB/EbfC family protein
MFKGLGSLSSLLKGAQEFRAQMERIQQELRQKRVEGSAGGGMVVVEMNGRQEVLACRIDPQLYEQQDREMVEELTVAAVNQALEKARALNAEEMNKMLGGLQIPGLSEALQQFNPSG